MIRNFIRNIILAYLPNRLSYHINILVNIKVRYHEAEIPLLLTILQNLKIVYGSPVSVDVGANLGLFSYLLNKSSGQVIAIEPQPKLAHYLKSVLPKNVTVFNLAVSDYTGHTILTIPKIKGLLGLASQQDALATIESKNPIYSSNGNVDLIEVKVDTLDNILNNYSRVDFIKIDVEGHELSVLRGSSSILQKFRPFMMIELFKKHNPNVLQSIELIFNQNYLCLYLIDSNIFICKDTISIIDILDNPCKFGPMVQNFFFMPAEKLEFFKKSVVEKYSIRS